MEYVEEVPALSFLVNATQEEANATGDAFYPDSVHCYGGEEQVNSSEQTSKQNSDKWFIKEEIAVFLEIEEIIAEAMEKIRDKDVEVHLFRSMLAEEDLARLNVKITENQANIEETFVPILKLIPKPYSAEEKEYRGVY